MLGCVDGGGPGQSRSGNQVGKAGTLRQRAPLCTSEEHVSSLEVPGRRFSW